MRLALGLGLCDVRNTTAGESFSAEATAVFDQMDVDGTAPDATRKTAINTLIAALKTAGVWTKCDRIYVLAAHEQTAGLIDWKTPGTDTLTNVSATAFTIDRGFTGDGAADYLHNTTDWSAMTQYTQNSAHTGFWAVNDIAHAASVVGDTVPAIGLCPRDATNNFKIRLNSSVTRTVANSSGAGYFVGARPDSANLHAYRNAVELGTGWADTSTAPTAGDVDILRVAGAFSTRQLALIHVGANLSAAEVSDAYTAFNNYMTAVGVV